MAPKRAAKDAGKPPVKASAHATQIGRITKAQRTPTRKTNKSSKTKKLAALAIVELNRNTSAPIDEVQSTTEAAAPTSFETQKTPGSTAVPSSNTMPATPVSARDRVLQTPELLENVLRFAGYKTLLTSVLRVNEYFNAIVTASPCLQKAMLESFSPPVPGQSDSANQFLFNAAITGTIHFPGSTATLEVGRCCGQSDRTDLCCEGNHFLTFVFVAGRGDLVEVGKSTSGWRKLRLLVPRDVSHKSCLARADIFHNFVIVAYVGSVMQEIPAHLTLGQMFERLAVMWESVTYY